MTTDIDARVIDFVSLLHEIEHMHNVLLAKGQLRQVFSWTRAVVVAVAAIDAIAKWRRDNISALFRELLQRLTHQREEVVLGKAVAMKRNQQRITAIPLVGG